MVRMGTKIKGLSLAFVLALVTSTDTISNTAQSTSRVTYDINIFVSCAKSRTAGFSLMKSKTSKVDRIDEEDPCYRLLIDHSKIHNRDWLPSMMASESSETATFDSKMTQRRLEKFASSVAYVYNHNNNKSGEYGRHKVALNQFSDLFDNEIPSMDVDALESLDVGDDEHDDTNYVYFRNEDDVFQTAAMLMMSGKHDDNQSNNDATSIKSFSDKLKAHHYGNKRFAESNTPDRGKQTPATLMARPVETDPSLDDLPADFDSNLYVEIWEDYDPKEMGEADVAKDLGKNYFSHNILVNWKSSEGIFGDRNGNVGDATFDKYLNWATKENPDGIPVVHPAKNQEWCKSCWAFTTAAIVESSVIRGEGFSAYNREILKISPSNVVNHADLSMARKKAAEAEHSAYQRADLSMQELIDCDKVEKGCIGGNPLLAYFYIKKYGIVANDDYPYRSQTETCKESITKNPLATVKSWGILPENDEDTMELVLRYIGPIAVRVYSSGQSFQFYQSGILNDTDCIVGHKADHVVLLVGYGEEMLEDGSKAKYWIVQNTWGVNWGENGMLRIARGIHNGTSVCGVAEEPNIALGGSFYPMNSTTEQAKIRRETEPTLTIQDDCQKRILGYDFCYIFQSRSGLISFICFCISVVLLVYLSVYMLHEYILSRRSVESASIQPLVTPDELERLKDEKVPNYSSL